MNADDYRRSRYINERVRQHPEGRHLFRLLPVCGAASMNARSCAPSPSVVDKFEIPMVKVTGGQRIDLLGIEKEDLRRPSGPISARPVCLRQAYAKGLRTVKTCVGSDWCRFGTQIHRLGIRIEKFMWGSWLWLLKLAVPGCLRNCAEATRKDIGVIQVDSVASRSISPVPPVWTSRASRFSARGKTGGRGAGAYRGTDADVAREWCLPF